MFFQRISHRWHFGHAHDDVTPRSSPAQFSLERYAVALICVVVACALRFVSEPFLDGELPYAYFAPAAMLAAWYGRFLPGLFALIVGMFLGYYFFVPPFNHLGPLKGFELPRLMSTAGPALLSIWIIELLHRSKLRVDIAMQRSHENAQRLQQEIRDRQRAENDLRFAHDLTLAISGTDNFHQALGKALQKICDFTGWSIGHAWIPSTNNSHAELCPQVCASHPGLARFRDASERTLFSPGVGIVGKVWQTKQPLWIRDVREAPEFIRAPVARELGIQSALFFPIVAGGKVIAILEFFAVEMRTQDEALVQLVSGVANQLANLVERKQAEDLLRESERRLKEAQALAHIGNWEWNIRRNQLIWSDELYKLFGVDPRDFKGSYGDFLERVHPDDRDYVQELVRGAIRTGKPILFEHRSIRPDGALRHIQCHGAPVRDEDGTVITLLGTAQDITEQKEMTLALAAARRQLEDYASSLEQMVGTRTAELEKSVKQLETFCYTIAHDLRAPLRSMEGFSRAILEDYAPQMDETGREYARRVMAGSKRMDQLIQDLLAYGRLTHATFPMTSVVLDELVPQIVNRFEAEMKAKGAEVEVIHPLPEVWSNALVLEQVITNILGNAIKFVAPGVQPRVRIWAEETPKAIRLSIEDNGIGIKQEHQDRIFRVFEKLHSTDEYEGTGIGLAIVNKGVERLGGRIGLHSTVGKGSRFWIELPKHSRKKGRAQGEKAQATVSTKSISAV